ncbi:hypothetical protein [Gilliamella sp. Pas-s95]|uniref:hypothetical protein n=1 Tax=Gilliamella sp. Pas-s95 TaxID=2687317 RepID=UPI00132C38DE|nr:hypothetical protein [Gilliamella sp. Pas-s95]MWN06477.1 hypothetical protein [Gilliamella sp. Pas-s95]
MYFNYSVYFFCYQGYCSHQDSSRALFLPLNLAKLLVISLWSIFLSKSPLFFSPLLFLFSFSVQALSVYTSKVIEGSAPYLTFDGGRTKLTTTDMLLAIKLPDGRIITSSTNTSSATNPIILPAESTLGSIDMLVPSSTNSVSLNDLITQGNWGDDDGDDGQDTSGATATGSISVSFTDKENRTVSRSDTLSICSAPYKVKLTSTAGSLTTRYGVPNSSTFVGGTATYYIKPDSSGSCYSVQSVRPNLLFGGTIGINSLENPRYAGPSNIWSPTKGFFTQSTNSSSYGLNFPTTGADGLYFDLLIDGVDASQLTWSPVMRGGITVTVTSITANDRWIPSADSGKIVARVKLNGPRASDAQINAANPSPLTAPSLPQTFELVGRDSHGNEVRYGFVLKQWFVNRGNQLGYQSDQISWCSRLGYRVPQVGELTNAKCGVNTDFPCINGIDGATPRSSDNGYQRRIGSGFLTEWGHMYLYVDAGFVNGNVWASDSAGSNGLSVYSGYGSVYSGSATYSRYGLCIAP